MRERNVNDGYSEKLPSKNEVTKVDIGKSTVLDVLNGYGRLGFDRPGLGIIIFLISTILLLGSIISSICYKPKVPFCIWVLSVSIKLNLLTVFLIISRNLPRVFTAGLSESNIRMQRYELLYDSRAIGVLLSMTLFAFIVKTVLEIKQTWNASKQVDPACTTPVLKAESNSRAGHE